MLSLIYILEKKSGIDDTIVTAYIKENHLKLNVLDH